MANTRADFWDHLPLRLKGALIVGAPVLALLVGALTSFWFDRQSAAAARGAARARAAYALVHDVDHHVESAAAALQRYTLTEDPDALPAIDSTILGQVQTLRELRDPRTGRPYPGLEQSSATLKDLLLSAALLGRDMASSDEPAERQEDALDDLSERMSDAAGALEVPASVAADAAAGYEADIRALERREQTADAVMLLVGLLGGLAAVAFFARNFTTRISELGAAAERLAAGDFSRPFPAGSDEIGVLGERLYSAFNEVRASEERTRLILETSADAYTAVDDEWTVIGWNRAAETILGWTKEEAIGRSLLELTVPEHHRAAHVDGMRAFLDGEVDELADSRIETTARRKDGILVPIDLSVVPVEAEGRVTFHSFVRDLTDAKKADEETADRARRMGEIIQTMSEMASAEMDVRRLHTLLLERARALTNADGAALQLEHDGMLHIVAGIGPVAGHVGRKLDIATTMTGRTLMTGRTFVTGDVEREHDVDAPLARAIGARSSLTVPLSDAGRVVGVLSVHSALPDAFDETDVTDVELLGGFFGAVISKIQAYVAREVVVRERTHALAELRELHAELEAKNDALVSATHEANAANAAKSEFLSRMSHELRTPLNAILGFTQLLQTEALEEDQMESLGHIESAGRHLLALINEVLEIARIESGNAPLSMTPVAVGELVRESVDLIRPLAAQRSIGVIVSGASDAATASGDGQKVKQVLLNLLSNAVKYNRDGGAVEVAVTSHGDLVEVAVTDTGPGIAPDKVRSLFTPFDRLGAEQTSVEGTGLGLSVSKQLAEAMGGSLSLSSVEGSGSTFSLRLQRSEPGVPPHEVSPPASRGTPARVPLSTVLYVEDNPSNARLVERALRTRPEIELRVAADGRTGYELAAALVPAMILLDMDLPDATGIEVLRRLRGDDRTRAIPVVMLSADATCEQREAARAAGAVDYLTKPVDLAELVATIGRVAAAPLGASA